MSFGYGHPPAKTKQDRVHSLHLVWALTICLLAVALGSASLSIHQSRSWTDNVASQNRQIQKTHNLIGQLETLLDMTEHNSGKLTTILDRAEALLQHAEGL